MKRFWCHKVSGRYTENPGPVNERRWVRDPIPSGKMGNNFQHYQNYDQDSVLIKKKPKGDMPTGRDKQVLAGEVRGSKLVK